MQNSSESRIPPHAEKKFEGTIFTTWQWEQELYDGSMQTFEGVTRPDYGMAVGVLPDQKILLAWDEQPDRGPILTGIGGRIEKRENPEEGTRREFLEEAGYKVGELVPWFTYEPGSKVAFTVHAFIARGLKNAGEPTLDPGEKIELRTFTFDEFLQLGSDDSEPMGGPIRDWMARIQLLEAQLDKDKRDTLYKLLYE